MLYKNIGQTGSYYKYYKSFEIAIKSTHICKIPFNRADGESYVYIFLRAGRDMVDREEFYIQQKN